MPLEHAQPVFIEGTTLLWQSFVAPNYEALEPVLDEMEACLLINGWTERDALVA